MPGGWDVLGLAGDPVPGDPGQVRGLAGRLLEQARLAEDNTARLSAVSGGGSALVTGGAPLTRVDHATRCTEALGGLPGELAKLGRAYRGASKALLTYAGSLEQAKAQAGTALRVAEVDRSRARLIADEAARLRGDAETRATREIEQALEGSGVTDRVWLRLAWETISAPFRFWDDFVSFAGGVAMVSGMTMLLIGAGGPTRPSGALPAGMGVVAGAVVLADAMARYRRRKGSLGMVALAALNVLTMHDTGTTPSPPAARSGAARAGAAEVRGGAVRVGAAAVRGGVGRAGAAAVASWQRGRRFFSQDPVHFPTGVVLLPQTDLDLPGVLPLRLTRTHLSSYRTGRWFGRSWASTLDQRLEADAEGLCLATETGALLAFPYPEPDRPAHPDGGLRLALYETDTGYTVTDPLTGLSTHFAETGSTEPGVLPIAAITDRNGNRIDVRYLDGLPTEIVHSGGYHLDVETSGGRVVELRLRGAGQRLLSYSYDETGDLTGVTNSSGLPMRFAYDDHGRLTRWQDRIGTWYAYTYDLAGRCVYGTGEAGVFNTEISYGDGVTRAYDSLGHLTTYHHNDLLQVTAETDPLGHTTRYRWDECDRLLARTDPLGRTTRYTYDDAGAPLTITRPDGATRRQILDNLHLPVAITDYDGTIKTLGRDERGNLTADGEETRTYDERGRPTTVTNALGHTTTIDCDPAGLPIAITDPSGAVTRYERDPFGRVTAVTDPLGHTTRQTWTVEGLPATRTAPGGATERHRYDAQDNLIEHVDAMGESTRWEIGPFGVATARTTPDGARLEFAHDTELRLEAVTDPQGLTWHYDYDPAGNLIRETDFNRRVLTYVRNPAGNLTERVNGAGQSTSYVYDVLDRLIGRRAGDRLTTFDYDVLGRLVRAANPDADLRLTRDADGRVTGETCNGRTLTSAYDALGRRVLRRTPSGAESIWAYDSRDLPLTVETAGQTFRFTHDAAGREISRDFGAGVRLTHEWDDDSHPRAQTVAAGRRVVQRRTYGHRRDGRLTEIDDLLAGRRRFDLDPVGRVTAVHGTGWSESCTYNVSGQITDDAQGPRAYTGTMVRQAGRTRYEYDRQGRTVLRQRTGLSSTPLTWHYTWDADDRLTTVTTPDGTRWRYLYDPLGRRIAKERADGSQRTDFVWDGDTLAEQSGESHTTAWDWEPGTSRPLSQTERRPGARERCYAVATDPAGAPAELVDAEGNVAWRAHAEAAEAADCPLRLSGQYEDAESGLYYDHPRHYDPDAGRYATADPIGLRGGWDPHAYVVNPHLKAWRTAPDPAAGPSPDKPAPPARQRTGRAPG
ncbi:DUF6531 domain-containing protein [Nonomuraea sp. NPDC050404]|uniref:DUF6531 domain-containing protein n=1 Tax=Nonomuraea sp. NPDC050404 TaxID=3155783 RepID=UPI0033E8BDC4